VWYFGTQKSSTFDTNVLYEYMIMIIILH
jgi:hypothetical protein